MSPSLLAFLTVLERHVRPTLPADGEWHFQRLVNFQAGEATLQLWEAESLRGQAEVRQTSQSDGSAAFAGSVQSTGEAPAGRRTFSFRPTSDHEVERQAQHVADLWRQIMPPGGASA